MASLKDLAKLVKDGLGDEDGVSLSFELENFTDVVDGKVSRGGAIAARALLRGGYLDRDDKLPELLAAMERAGNLGSLRRALEKASRVDLATALQKRVFVEEAYDKGREGDQFSVWQLFELVHATPSVCRIKSPSTSGTGFVVADGVVLTARHVVKKYLGADREWKAAEGGREFLELSEPVKLQFGFSEHEAVAKIAGVPKGVHEVLLEAGTRVVAGDALDFCFLLVGGIQQFQDLAAPFRKPLPLATKEMQRRAVEDHLPLAVVHHPDGKPMHISLQTGKGPACGGDPAKLLHRAPTQPGSSGAPVLAMDDGGVCVVSLHRASAMASDDAYIDAKGAAVGAWHNLSLLLGTIGEMPNASVVGDGDDDEKTATLAAASAPSVSVDAPGAAGAGSSGDTAEEHKSTTCGPEPSGKENALVAAWREQLKDDDAISMAYALVRPSLDPTLDVFELDAFVRRRGMLGKVDAADAEDLLEVLAEEAKANADAHEVWPLVTKACAECGAADELFDNSDHLRVPVGVENALRGAVADAEAALAAGKAKLEGTKLKALRAKRQANVDDLAKTLKRLEACTPVDIVALWRDRFPDGDDFAVAYVALRDDLDDDADFAPLDEHVASSKTLMAAIKDMTDEAATDKLNTLAETALETEEGFMDRFRSAVDLTRAIRAGLRAEAVRRSFPKNRQAANARLAQLHRQRAAAARPNNPAGSPPMQRPNDAM